MRLLPFALIAPVVLLASCGGPSQVKADLSNDQRAENPAAGSLLELRLSLGDATKIMHERHEGMESIGKAAKALNRELGGSSPDQAVVRTSAAQIADLSRHASNWFPAGTGPEVGKTGAKPEIWQSPQDFAAKLGAFQKAALIFDDAARGNDMGAVKLRFAELGRTCKACHDKYRSEMKH